MARTKLLYGSVAAIGIALGAVARWPSRAEHAGYHFARRVAGEGASPLWKLAPDALDRVSSEDFAELEHLTAALDHASTHARQSAPLLSVERPDALSSEQRRKIRDIWWSFFEPLVALDRLKRRYYGWYGVDYLLHAPLHARSFAIVFGALCVQVDAGQELLDLVAGKKLAQALFDEEMPELGVPRGTFSALRAELGRARDHSFVPAGSEWFSVWIKRHLGGPAGERVVKLIDQRSRRALERLLRGGALRTAENKSELLKSKAFEAWFPVQKEVAEWAGDTRVVPQDRRLISDANLAAMKQKLKPGDILIERRNWYLSNVGLPGFWPHAALYTGTQDEIRAHFDADPDVAEQFGKLSEHLARRHPKAWKSLGERDREGHPHSVVEAVSEGVVATSFEHSCGADYAAALRPRLSKLDRARALDRALGYFGRPYDFDFDFATDDAIVCSELVMKAYERTHESGGLVVPWVTVAGRRAIPPTEIVRTFAAERGKDGAQLDFVAFLEGREKGKQALDAGADALAASVARPKWDVLQP
jgi:hypothetical protein